MPTESETYFASFAKPFIDVTILLCFIGYVTWHLWSKKHPASPPGTRGLPLLGSIISLRAYPERVMAKWSQKYGPVCMVKIGLSDVVVLGSVKAANEAFAKSSSFADRPSNAVSLFSSEYGILLVHSGLFHTEQRRFGLNKLRDFGMGKRILEPTLIEISNELCDKLSSLCESGGGVSAPTTIEYLVYDTISNIISHMVFGYKVAEEKEEFRSVLRQVVEPSKDNILCMIMFMAPFMQYLPVFSSAKWKQDAFRDKVQGLIAAEVDEHIKTHESDNPRDYVDCFLDEMAKAERLQHNGSKSETTSKYEGNNNEKDEDQRDKSSSEWRPLSSFSRDQLIHITMDLFMAATDTTSTTIMWLITILCKHPDIQDKVQEELESVYGQSGTITMRLMDKLPYFRAVLQETTRYRPAVPISLPHVATQTDYLMGYRIPKGATLLANIFGIHHDPKIWPEPERFLPERHLDASGLFVKSPNVIPFNVGTRSCLGQQLAKMQLFTLSASLLRKFRFAFKPSEDPDMKGVSMVSLRPQMVDMVISKRF